MKKSQGYEPNRFENLDLHGAIALRIFNQLHNEPGWKVYHPYIHSLENIKLGLKASYTNQGPPIKVKEWRDLYAGVWVPAGSYQETRSGVVTPHRSSLTVRFTRDPANRTLDDVLLLMYEIARRAERT